MKSNYDEVKVRMEKGKKEVLQAHAATKNESLNGFVNRAIDETVARDNDNV
jgi:predicted HicB family RNase H-like nuclease